jgi:hypothetical protein
VKYDESIIKELSVAWEAAGDGPLIVPSSDRWSESVSEDGKDKCEPIDSPGRSEFSRSSETGTEFVELDDGEEGPKDG